MSEFASSNLTAGKLNAIVKNLGGEEGALRFLRGEMEVVAKSGTSKPLTHKPYLRLLYAEDRITLPVTGGQRTIADAKKVFWGIDSDFKNWKTNQESAPTPEADVKVLELYQDATFKQMFSSLGKPLDELCLTQDQIIAFCERHKDKLRREGWANLFLFKVGDEFFVVRVHVHDDGALSTYVNRFEDGNVWDGVASIAWSFLQQPSEP